jgi:hypothetical protein
MSARPLQRLQRGLEQLYRVDPADDIAGFLVDDAARAAIDPARRPREQLLVSEHGGELSIGLFVDEGVLATLAQHDPTRALTERNLGEFLLAVEGVSHFVLAVYCARGDRSVSALELELQAEVDKYVTCALLADVGTGGSAALRARLFHDVAFEPDLDADERDRYRAANDNAARYAAHLERAYLGPRRIPEMLAALRRFYRLPLAGKLADIARAA